MDIRNNLSCTQDAMSWFNLINNLYFNKGICNEENGGKIEQERNEEITQLGHLTAAKTL